MPYGINGRFFWMTVNGMAFYSYTSTFEVPETSGVMLSGKMQRIREMIKNF